MRFVEGEGGTPTSEVSPEILKPGCEFCYAPVLGENSTFYKLHGKNQVMQMRSASMSLKDSYPLTEGHTMTVSKGHYPSMLSHPNQEAITRDIIADIQFKRKTYEGFPLIVFEHGSGEHDTGDERGVIQVSACGTRENSCGNHNHNHNGPACDPETGQPIPVTLDVAQEKLDFFLELPQSHWNNIYDNKRFRRATNFLESRNSLEIGKKPYLYVAVIQPNGDLEEATYVHESPDEQIPSQVLRRVFAPILYGRDSVQQLYWDYHVADAHIFMDGFTESAAHFTNLVDRFDQRIAA